MLAVGETGEGAVAVTFRNAIGAPITNLAAGPVGTPAESAMLMAAGQSVADGEQVTVSVKPADNALCNMVIECEGARYTLHNVDFATVQNAVIHREGDVAYLEFTSGGNAISTLAQENEIAHPVAQEPAPAPAPAPAETGSAQETTYYEEPVYYDQPAAGQAPAQGEDACVTDIVLR